jgi:dephospho-CoA kinase
MIIGLIGNKRVGKDTVADFLCSTYNFKKYAFADGVKETCKVLFDFTDEQMNNDIKEDIDIRWNISPRKAMQFIGTEMMQYKIQELIPDIHKLFWVNRLRNKIIMERNNIDIKDIHDNIVITDFRFLHEINEFKKYNIMFIHILRDRTYEGEDSHISENELTSIDLMCLDLKKCHIIYNNGTLDDLYSKIAGDILSPSTPSG